MKLLVTGFGRFDGRAENGSALALSELKKKLGWLNTRVLPVDGVRAPRRMSQALRELRPDAVIMLGEAREATSLRLEVTAHNELDFPIPDNGGWQPRGEVIIRGAPAALPASLPREALEVALGAAGHPLAVSSDAGRYLCNHLMFHTLHFLSKHSPGTVAGFIHLPLAADLASARVVDALALVIDVLHRRG